VHWEEKYSSQSRIWGDQPSELALIAAEYLRDRAASGELESVIDLGCGYGRDAGYLARQLGCRVLGIDSSQEAIRMALASTGDGDGVEYRCCDFCSAGTARHDAVLASNLYHLLGEEDRRRFGLAVDRLLNRGGLLFLNSVSERDPHHFGEGGAKRKETGTGSDGVEPSSEAELRSVFGALSIAELYEHEYLEPHATGEPHHHVSWILVAERP
jgi:cyclopropane fatty-acyl-phospholipid synthase-like methyltransferase